MNDRNDWNRKVTEEFRANAGNVEQFKGIPLLLLHHTGAKSGRSYINPLAYLPDGKRMVVFASKGGADTNPDWYHNLVAHPDVKVELGNGDVIDAKAVVLQGAERERIYNLQVERVPVFAEYRAKTSREIPVIALDPE
jgi:deazaflavin-dependent oxidoreductase (nitroreductase family)